MRSGYGGARRIAAAAVAAGWVSLLAVGRAVAAVLGAGVGASGWGSASASAVAMAVGTPGAGRVQRARRHSRGCGRGVPMPRRIAPGIVGSTCRGGIGTVGGILAWCRCPRRCRSGSGVRVAGQWHHPCRGRSAAARQVRRPRLQSAVAWRRLGGRKEFQSNLGRGPAVLPLLNLDGQPSAVIWPISAWKAEQSAWKA